MKVYSVEVYVDLRECGHVGHRRVEQQGEVLDHHGRSAGGRGHHEARHEILGRHPTDPVHPERMLVGRHQPLDVPRGVLDRHGPDRVGLVGERLDDLLFDQRRVGVVLVAAQDMVAELQVLDVAGDVGAVVVDVDYHLGVFDETQQAQLGRPKTGGRDEGQHVAHPGRAVGKVLRGGNHAGGGGQRGVEPGGPGQHASGGEQAATARHRAQGDLSGDAANHPDDVAAGVVAIVAVTLSESPATFARVATRGRLRRRDAGPAGHNDPPMSRSPVRGKQ